MNEIEFTEPRVAFAGPWIGEFGWEIMTWVPYLRKLSRDYDKMYISTFEGAEALYTGFHCEVEFVPHSYPDRVDDWTTGYAEALSNDQYIDLTGEGSNHIKPIKEYRVDGEYVRYGSPVMKGVSILFHARGIDPQFKNWDREKWKKLAEAFPGANSIGSYGDQNVTEYVYNDAGLPQLIDVIASASVVIGQSSGVMHLALICATPVVVWGDDNLMNFGESLEMRYKETWNPFHVPVTWIPTEKPWDPEPEQILDALKAPDPKTLKLVKDATDSDHHMIAVAFMGKKDGNDCLYAQAGGSNFPAIWLEKAEEDLTRKIKESIRNAKAERIPDSWL